MDIYEKEKLLHKAILSIGTILNGFDELYEILLELNDDEYMNIMDFIDGTTHFEWLLSQAANSIRDKRQNTLYQIEEGQKQDAFEFTQLCNEILEYLE